MRRSSPAALAVAALNLVPGLLGARGLVYPRRHLAARCARAFWVLLRVGQGAALALAIAVGSLAAAGHYSDDELFYLYALLPLAVGFVAEQLRVASAQTILDQRGLEDAQAVGDAARGRAARARRRDPAREMRRDGAVGARRRVPGAARRGHGSRVLRNAVGRPALHAGLGAHGF